MSEDVSATMRVGITIILVAALVATVLNLMVTSNSLLSGGQTTLQGGIDSVSAQEFASYDNTKVSGTQVNTAMSLFQGRDVAILLQTKAMRGDKDWKGASAVGEDNCYLNYGALVTSNGKASSSSNLPKGVRYNSDVTGTGLDNAADADMSMVSEQANLVRYVGVANVATPTDKVGVFRTTGASSYTAYLHNTNGLVDTNYSTIGCTLIGNDQYILTSARFSSVLIKDPTGSIIGIVFTQLN